MVHKIHIVPSRMMNEGIDVTDRTEKGVGGGGGGLWCGGRAGRLLFFNKWWMDGHTFAAAILPSWAFLPVSRLVF